MEGTIATILMFAGNFAPKAWSFCDGSTINIASNTALFSLLGTTYGGNGTTNFKLPDLRGRVALGAGQGPGLSNYNLGQMGGAEKVTLTVNQMPAHTHAAGAVAIAVSDSASAKTAAGNILGTPSTPIYATRDQGNANYGGFSAQVLNSGGSQPISTIQPYESVYFVICTYGIFPSRS